MVSRRPSPGMTLYAKGGGKAVWSEWHERRREARENHHSLTEFGEIEITTYDLDTAGVTGEDNPETYMGQFFGPDPILEPTDLREEPWRGGY